MKSVFTPSEPCKPEGQCSSVCSVKLGVRSVESLRQRLRNPESVATALGILDGTKSHNRGYLVRCPFHSDRTASCSISIGSDENLYVYCFGCGARGDVFTLIAGVAGLNVKAQFPTVLIQAEAIAESLALLPAAPETSELVPAPLTGEEFDAFVEGLISLSPLVSQEDVAGYVLSRRVVSQAVPDRWAALPESRLDQERLLDSVADVVGADIVARSGFCGLHGGFTWCDHRLVIPWRDVGGKITTVQRRLIEPGQPKYVFATGRKPSALYGSDRAARFKGDKVTFVEGALDVLAVRKLCDHHNVERLVLGLPGAKSWRSEWATIAKGRTAVIALDNDAAGEGAVAAIVADLKLHGARHVQRVVPYAGAKDWADALAAEDA